MKTSIQNMQLPRSIIVLLISIMSSLISISCEKFVDANDPAGMIPREKVFEDEATSTAAVMTLYGNLRDNVLLTGDLYGMNVLMGLYADELDYYAAPGQLMDAFYHHQIVASDEIVKLLWDAAYNLIYMSNSAIEGIEASPDLSLVVKDQLTGEALFIRAITHFYMVNLFGDIPYITTSDYLINKDVSRLPSEEVYDKILADLIRAKSLLTDEYVSAERIRANGYAVSALLARVYLYAQRWQDAETESTILINATDVFELETDPADEFLKESSSAILQLKPMNEGENTREATVFVFTSGPPPLMALNPALVNAFDPADLRRQNWIKEITEGSEIWYAPYKYKQIENTGTSLEYSVILRLPEQYLIRAEARVHLGDLPGAIQDINTVRNRAGLPGTEAASESDILQAISSERIFELFTEFGHRWFDLKRTGQAGAVLSTVKPNWKSTDVLFPVPESELLLNPNLLPQNLGY